MQLPKIMKMAVEGAIIQFYGHSTLLTVKNDDNDIPEPVIDRLALMFQEAKISCRRDRLPKRAIKSSVGENTTM